MKAHLSTITKTYFNCPNCGERSKDSLDHLIEDLNKESWKQAIKLDGYYPRFGPWGCHSCGANISGVIKNPSEIELTICEGTNVKTWDLLVLPPQDKPVYFVVGAKDYDRGTDSSRKPYEGKEYFYNEHTCPVNWFRGISMVISDGDNDPHGLFEYVESVDQEKEYQADHDENEVDVNKAFPTIFKEG